MIRYRCNYDLICPAISFVRVSPSGLGLGSYNEEVALLIKLENYFRRIRGLFDQSERREKFNFKLIGMVLIIEN